MHTLVVGAGFSGSHIAARALKYGTVCGTSRDVSNLVGLQDMGVETLMLDAGRQDQSGELLRDENAQATLKQFSRITHLVICAGPARGAPFGDPVLRYFSRSRNQFPQLQWVGYLSTIGVYGNHDGNWVDETTPCTSTQTRSIMRREAELGWQSLAELWGVPLSIMRLSGIYGPGRNALEDALAGRARMLIKPGQIFNRIHVVDLATACLLAAQAGFKGIVNITDDLPAAPQDVVRYAHKLAGRTPPQAIDFATAQITDMARSFYSENKRVSNALSKQALGMSYQYSSYREGMDALWQSIVDK